MTPVTLPSPGWVRCAASVLYESFLVVALLLLGVGVLTLFQKPLGSLFVWVVRCGLITLLWVYFSYCWVKTGQTLAMKTWRIRLVDVCGQSLCWKRAHLRFAILLVLFAGIPLIFYSVWIAVYGEGHPMAWVVMLWWAVPFLFRFCNPEGLFLQDKLAGTCQVVLPKQSQRACCD